MAMLNPEHCWIARNKIPSTWMQNVLARIGIVFKLVDMDMH